VLLVAHITTILCVLNVDQLCQFQEKMYKFDKHTLEFIKLKWMDHITKIGIVGSLLIIGIFFMVAMLPGLEKTRKEHEVKVIIAKQNEFSEEKLITLIKNLNFPFPHVVLAQSMIETGYYTSPIFKENNNLFGMKEAVVRITTCTGTNNGHAVYKNWMDSVYDRAFYSATYLSSINTEDEYYSYLAQYYAQDKEYVSKLKRIIQERELKSKF